jgi:hypothetical protein
VAKDKVTWLSKWRLDGAEEKDSRGTERSDNEWRMIRIAEGRQGGHDGFDKEDAAKNAYPGKGPDFVLDGNLPKPGEWGKR